MTRRPTIERTVPRTRRAFDVAANPQSSSTRSPLKTMQPTANDRGTRPKVFIASSSEGLGIATTLHMLLDPNVDATIWPDRFRPGDTTIDALVNAATTLDFAVLVLTPDDVIESRGTLFEGPRDNVLFEMGLFMGQLGRNRAFLVHREDHDVKIPSDLAGVTRLAYRQRESGDLKESLRSLATRICLAINEAPSKEKEVLPFVGLLRARLTRTAQGRRVAATLDQVAGLDAIDVWPENRPDVEKIADLLLEYENSGMSDRRFVVFFGQVSTRLMTVFDLISALRTFEPSKLYCCLQNVEKHFSLAPVPVITVRELLRSYLEGELGEAQALFDGAGLIERVHPDASDVRTHVEGHRPRQIVYEGVLPARFESGTLQGLFEAMEDVRRVGARALTAGVTASPTHIVISRWGAAPEPWMVITATNTDKSQLALFADTPIVLEDENRLVFFGDPGRLPSSEAVPHWYIHKELFGKGDRPFSCLVHFHSPRLNALALRGDIQLLGGLIATVPHIDYGTVQMGRLIVQAMIEKDVRAVSVQKHGQWFAADSLSQALQEGIAAHEATGARLGHGMNF